MMTTSCLSQQSLFQIDFSFPNASQRFYFGLVHPSNHSFFEFESFTPDNKVENFARCLPTEGCYAVQITYIDPESFNLLWDGREVYGDQYRHHSTHKTFAEFGSGCVPECSDEESLFELHYLVGEVGTPNWRLEDEAGSEIVGCNSLSGCGDSDDVIVRRSCVPRTKCSRFIFGTSFHSVFAENSWFQVKMDSNITAEEYDVDFRAVEIGSCTPCGESESEFEFFLHRKTFYIGADPSLTYRLRRTISNTTILEHTIETPANYSNPPEYDILQYVRKCIPSHDCYEFSISVPDQSYRDEEDYYYESENYQLKLDGVYWANDDYNFGGSYEPIIYSATKALGECDVRTLCDEESEFLLNVEIATSADMNFTDSRDVRWFVEASSAERRAETDTLVAPLEHFEGGYHAGSAFKAFECLPRNETLTFGVVDPAPLGVSWSISRDAVPLECRDGRGEDGGYFSSSTITPLDGSCGDAASSFSPGAIAGIVLGGVAACSLVAFAGWKLKKRTSDTKGKGIDVGTSEDEEADGRQEHDEAVVEAVAI